MSQARICGAAVLGAAILVAGGATSLAAQDPNAIPRMDVVVTTGEAVVKAAPDLAFVTIAVEIRAKTPGEAQRQNAETMTAVQQKLQTTGIPQNAVRTIAVELSPEFDYANGRQQLRGYVARNSIEVRVEMLNRLGDVIDSAVGVGATNVTGVRFDVKRRDEMEREAVRLAVAQARSRADAAAAGAGRTIDRVVRVEDAGSVGPPPRPVMMTQRLELSAEAATPVAPGELEIRARITLTAAFK